MSYKINLHTHTLASDGDSTIVEMARCASSLGHCALVVTDHDYYLGYLKSLNILRKAREESPIPIILGSEISTPIGECLMFGKENLNRWFKDYKASYWNERQTSSVHADFVENLGFFENVTKEECPLILCHPYTYSEFTNRDTSGYKQLVAEHPQISKLLVGYEVQNQMTRFNAKKLEKDFKNSGIKKLKRFYNSDAHSTADLRCCFNEVERPITTEEQLIEFLLRTEK